MWLPATMRPLIVLLFAVVSTFSQQVQFLPKLQWDKCIVDRVCFARENCSPFIGTLSLTDGGNECEHGFILRPTSTRQWEFELRFPVVEKEGLLLLKDDNQLDLFIGLSKGRIHNEDFIGRTGVVSGFRQYSDEGSYASFSWDCSGVADEGWATWLEEDTSISLVNDLTKQLFKIPAGRYLKEQIALINKNCASLPVATCELDTSGIRCEEITEEAILRAAERMGPLKCPPGMSLIYGSPGEWTVTGSMICGKGQWYAERRPVTNEARVLCIEPSCSNCSNIENANIGVDANNCTFMTIECAAGGHLEVDGLPVENATCAWNQTNLRPNWVAEIYGEMMVVERVKCVKEITTTVPTTLPTTAPSEPEDNTTSPTARMPGVLSVMFVGFVISLGAE